MVKFPEYTVGFSIASPQGENRAWSNEKQPTKEEAEQYVLGDIVLARISLSDAEERHNFKFVLGFQPGTGESQAIGEVRKNFNGRESTYWLRLA